MKKSTFSNFYLTLFSSIIILFIGFIFFTDVIFHQEDHLYSLIALLIIFPIIFFLQGVLTKVADRSIFIDLITISIIFIITILIWLNSSALGYLVLYVLFGFLGYGIMHIFKKRKER